MAEASTRADAARSKVVKMVVGCIIAVVDFVAVVVGGEVFFSLVGGGGFLVRGKSVQKSVLVRRWIAVGGSTFDSIYILVSSNLVV